MNKKAFTLIELIGVITVLGLISLLIAPTIINQIRNSKDKIDNVTEKLIYAATDLYLDNKQSDYPRYDGAVYCLTLEDLVNDGRLSGPVLDSNGDEISLDKIIAVDVKNSNYNYRMPSSCQQNLVKNFSELTTTPNTCATNKTAGACAIGTMFTIMVNEIDTEDFYVIQDTGSKVTLIMSENLGDTVAWYADDADNSYGPINAINYLDELTDEEWSNISKKPYTYSGIGEDGKTRVYNDITRTMRARMLTYDEASSIITANNNTMPDWLYAKLGDYASLPIGYWTSTAFATNSGVAWVVNYGGGLDNSDLVYNDYNIAVRPVIELFK